jgi:hypothetical protein
LIIAAVTERASGEQHGQAGLRAHWSVSGGLLATMAVAGCAQNRQVRMNAAAT